MRKTLQRLIPLYLILILLSVSSFKIFGGSVDGTPPSTLPVPGTGSLLTASGVYWSAEGTFYGSRNSDTRVYLSSNGGINWTLTPQGLFNGGMQDVSGAILLGTHGNGSTQIIRRSTDGGTTFSTVFSVASSLSSASQRRTIEKNTFDGLWWTTLSYGGESRTLFSNDNGSNWTTSETSANFCGNGAAGIAFNGSTIVIGTGVGSSCTESIRVSTNNGGSWASYTPACTPTNGEHNYSSPVFIFNTFYISVMGNSGNGCILSSSNGTTWSEWSNMPFGSGASSSFYGSLGSFFDNSNYYIYIAIKDLTDGNKLKVWRSPVTSVSWTMIYDTGIVQEAGNLLNASNNKIYFGTTSGNFYRLD